MLVGPGEDLPEAAHVQLPRQRATGQLGTDERGEVEAPVAPRADRAGQAAAAVAPRADQRRQAGQRAEEHRPVLVVLGTDQGADRRRTGGAVGDGQRLDLGGVEPGDRCGPLRRPVGHVFDEVVVAVRVRPHPLVVDQPVAHQHVDHRQHQGDVGAGQWLDEPVGGLGRDRADRVDDHDPRPVAPGRLDHRPQVTVGQPRVRAPQQDQLRVAQLGRVEALGGAVGRPRAGGGDVAADRPQQPARAQPVPEPLGEEHRQHALVAGVAVRQHRLGTVLGDERVEAPGDLVERLVPRDAGELAGPLRARCGAAGGGSGPGECTRSRKRLTFGHSSPCENGCSGLPRSCTATPSRTVTCQPQLSGQS